MDSQINNLRFAGYVTHPQVNGGKPVPAFENTLRADRPSINTMEGWNALSRKNEVSV